MSRISPPRNSCIEGSALDAPARQAIPLSGLRGAVREAVGSAPHRPLPDNPHVMHAGFGAPWPGHGQVGRLRPSCCLLGGSLSGGGCAQHVPQERARWPVAVPAGQSQGDRAESGEWRKVPTGRGHPVIPPLGGRMPQKRDSGKDCNPWASSAPPKASMNVTQSRSTASSHACSSVTSIRRTPDSHLLT